MQKSEGFLKFIIVYKALMGIIELIISLSFINILNKNLERSFTRLAVTFNFGIDNHFLKAIVRHIEGLNSSTLIGITSILLVFGIINVIEAYGLYIKKRWAEWLTVVATSLLIPLELYTLAFKVSFIKVVILVLNIAIVYYLARNKDLFSK